MDNAKEDDGRRKKKKKLWSTDQSRSDRYRATWVLVSRPISAFQPLQDRVFVNSTRLQNSY